MCTCIFIIATSTGVSCLRQLFSHSQHITTGCIPSVFDRWQQWLWCASPFAMHPQINRCPRAQCPPVAWQTGWGGAWASCLTLHLTVFARVCINGQFMSSCSVCFKATYVHLHTHVIMHSHAAVHTQPCAHAAVMHTVTHVMVLEVGCTHRWRVGGRQPFLGFVLHA